MSRGEKILQVKIPKITLKLGVFRAKIFKISTGKKEKKYGHCTN